MLKYCGFVLAIFCSNAFAQSYEWVNVRVDSHKDGSSYSEAIDIKNTIKDPDHKNIRLFWKKTNFNFLGTSLENKIFFTYTKIDCQKQMWTTLILQQFNGNTLVQTKDTSNWQFPWNFFDLKNISDSRTYNIICNQ